MKKRPKTGQPSPEVVVEVAATTPDENRRILRCLIDSGSSESIILDEFIVGFAKQISKRDQQWMTKGGVFRTSARCAVPFCIVDFSTSKKVTWTFHVDSTTRATQAGYDMIIGRDLLRKLGIDIKFSSGTLKWEDTEIPMREYGELRDRNAALHCYYAQDDVAATKQLTKRAVQILDSKYEAIDVSRVVSEQVGLDTTQKAALFSLLDKYKVLFNGELGDWDSKPVSIELQPNAKPFHSRAYPVPQVHEAAMRREVERLVMIGVLEEANDSEWGAPTFIIPKKDGRIRFISDFRKLNQYLKRKPFPIPKIQDMLLKLNGFTYASALDLNMGYYTIRLDPDAQKLCTIVLPRGKYKYTRLRLGAKICRIHCAPRILHPARSYKNPLRAEGPYVYRQMRAADPLRAMQQTKTLGPAAYLFSPSRYLLLAHWHFSLPHVHHTNPPVTCTVALWTQMPQCQTTAPCHPLHLVTQHLLRYFNHVIQHPKTAASILLF